MENGKCSHAFFLLEKDEFISVYINLICGIKLKNGYYQVVRDLDNMKMMMMEMITVIIATDTNLY